jgi:type I restriction enzyme M protein
MLKKKNQNIFSFSKEDNLLRVFETIHDYIYANDGLSAQQTLEEFVKVLFVKISDEQSNQHQFKKSTKNFAIDLMRQLFTETKKQYDSLFDKDEKIKLSENVLVFIIDQLQNISLLDSTNDAKGLAFQKFLSRQEKQGQGQFFTPEPVVDFCVKMIDPKLGETILDPACGSGGFLVSTLNYICRNKSQIYQSYCKIHGAEHASAASRSVCSGAKPIAHTGCGINIGQQLFGLDINQSIVRIAKMKFILEGISNIHLSCRNTLDNIETVKQQLNQENGFDIILTNPPFGAKISDITILGKFDLGHKWTHDSNVFYRQQKLHNTQLSEILFIERSLQLLKEGGRMGIVLPNGNFDNPSLAYLRNYIKERANILAVIKLPQETFIPFGTGVKTSLLFLEKKTSDAQQPKKIFFSAVSKLGYQGNKNGTPVFKSDNFGNPIQQNGKFVVDEDFTDILQDYQNGKNFISANSYTIDYDQLNCRLDCDYYSPIHRQILGNLTESNSVRLGDICDVVKEKSKKLKSPDAVVEYIELSDINTHSFEIINSTQYVVHELPSRASYEIQTGDIITAIAGNSVGTRKHATAWVSNEYDGCICTNGFRVFRNFRIDPYYFLYFLKSEMFLKQMITLRTGAAIPAVSDTNLNDVRIYLPDNIELKNISALIKKSFALRRESKLIIDNVRLLDNRRSNATMLKPF